MDAEPNGSGASPVDPQRGRLTPEQIDTPEAVFHVSQES